MFENTLWVQPLYRETALIVVIFLMIICLPFFFIKDKKTQYAAIWASFKSWFFYVPAVMVLFALMRPWPVIILTLCSIYACKIFYQMVGMYHRSWFVWLTYFFIIGTGFLVHEGYDQYYDLMPMVFMGASFFIPLIRNSAKHMIQYVALSQMAFIFFGWSFLHLGRMLDFENGIYIALYIYILAEVAENSSTLVNYFFGKRKFFKNITTLSSFEGIIFSVLFTVLIAWAMRHLLPNRSEPYWLSAGLIASIVGHIGNVVVSVIRRDLKIKPSGIFIIGRGDIVDRLDKLIFISPVCYYMFKYLGQG